MILLVNFLLLTNKGTRKVVKRPIIAITPINNSWYLNSVTGMLDKCVLAAAKAKNMVIAKKITIYSKIPALTF